MGLSYDKSNHSRSAYMTPTRILASWLIIAAALLGPAHAQNDQPTPPEDVFRYVIFDAGDALEIDWALDSGAFLYADDLSFESGDSSVSLMSSELPQSDDGKYDGNFFVRVPYQVTGDRPASIPLTIKSRGGVAGGNDYPAQTWIETVELAQPRAATKKLDFSSLGGSNQSEFPPPDEVFFPDVFAVDGNTIEVGSRIIPGFYLYKNKISVNVVGDKARAGSLELPKGKVHTDEFFGEQEVYYDEVMARLSIARATPEAMDLKLEVNYQGCADDGLCYVPLTRVMTVSRP